MQIRATGLGTNHARSDASLTSKKKLGAAAASFAIGSVALTGCSSESPNNDGSPSATGEAQSSSDVLTAAECAARDDVYQVGTYLAGMDNVFVPYESREQMLSSIHIPDGPAGIQLTGIDGDLNIEAFPESLKHAIWESYTLNVQDPDLDNNDKQYGYVVLYGDEGKISQYRKYEDLESRGDGELDGDFKVCTFNERQGHVSKDQLLYNQS